MGHIQSGQRPPADIGKILRTVLIAAFAAVIIAVASNQSIKLLMNITEFAEVFTKPLYYSTLSGLVLAAIAVARVNFIARHSMTWYAIRLIITFLNRGRHDSHLGGASQYSEFKMGKTSFALWQFTKVMLFAPVFTNIMFGMAFDYVTRGSDIGLSSLRGIFLIPFSDIPMGGSYARENVIPMLAGLTLLVPALINALGIRLFLYVGISGGVHIASIYVRDKKQAKPKFMSYISAVEIIAGVAILWTRFNIFFSGVVDYNTRYILSITIALGATLLAYGFVAKRHAKVIIYRTKTAHISAGHHCGHCGSTSRVYNVGKQRHGRNKKDRMVRTTRCARDRSQPLYAWDRPDRNLELRTQCTANITLSHPINVNPKPRHAKQHKALE